MSLVSVGAELLAAKERLEPFKNNVTVFGSQEFSLQILCIKMPMS